MIDSRTAAHEAVAAALSASAPVTALADIWAHAEEDTQPSETRDLVLIGFASATNAAGKDGGLDDVTIEVLCYVRKPDPTDLYILSSAVRTAIEGQPMTIAGAVIEKPEFISADPTLMDDGETYFDTLTFRMLVQSL